MPKMSTHRPLTDLPLVLVMRSGLTLVSEVDQRLRMPRSLILLRKLAGKLLSITNGSLLVRVNNTCPAAVYPAGGEEKFST